MTVSEQEYLRLALADSDAKWELFCGELRCRPPMTWERARTAARLGHDLQRQLSRDDDEVLSEAGRLRRSETQYFIPDVMVVPVPLAQRLFREPGMLAAFPESLPFVAESGRPQPAITT